MLPTQNDNLISLNFSCLKFHAIYYPICGQSMLLKIIVKFLFTVIQLSFKGVGGNPPTIVSSTDRIHENSKSLVVFNVTVLQKTDEIYSRQPCDRLFKVLANRNATETSYGHIIYRWVPNTKSYGNYCSIMKWDTGFFQRILKL